MYSEDLSVAVEGTQIQKGTSIEAQSLVSKVVYKQPLSITEKVKTGSSLLTTFTPYYNAEFRGKGRCKIQDVVVPGAELLVQVVKEAVEQGGAYHRYHVSRTVLGVHPLLRYDRCESQDRRRVDSEKLKEIISSLDVQKTGASLYVQLGATSRPNHSRKIFKRLLRLWGHVQAKYSAGNKPEVVHREPDVIVRTPETRDVDEIVIDDLSVLQRLEKELAQFARYCAKTQTLPWKNAHLFQFWS